MNEKEMAKAVLNISIDEIIPNRFQPRLAFDDESLNELANSIKEHGIIQPLVVRKLDDKYEIIAGERRFKASKIAGLTKVPVIVTTMDDNKSAEVAIVENIQRKGLTPIEEAKSYQAILEKSNITQEELAKKMGISQSSISNKLRLLTLDETVQDALLNEKISERHARTLLKIPNKQLQRELLNKTIKERLTVRSLENEIKKLMGSDTMKEFEDIPVVSNPDIAKIINNSVDITSLNQDIPKEDVLDLIPEEPKEKPKPVNNLFGTPEKMPTKFFNFLEDTAANMDIEEIMPDFEEEKEEKKEESNELNDLLTRTENIEMLDDFFIPIIPTEEKVMNDEYLDSVIKTIRNLNLDSDKVVVEEINLPSEYHINIKIKKDKL